MRMLSRDKQKVIASVKMAFLVHRVLQVIKENREREEKEVLLMIFICIFITTSIIHISSIMIM